MAISYIKRITNALAIAALAATITGCKPAPVQPAETNMPETIYKSVSIDEIENQPDKYNGQFVDLVGKIKNAENSLGIRPSSGIETESILTLTLSQDRANVVCQEVANYTNIPFGAHMEKIEQMLLANPQKTIRVRGKYEGDLLRIHDIFDGKNLLYTNQRTEEQENIQTLVGTAWRTQDYNIKEGQYIRSLSEVELKQADDSSILVLFREQSLQDLHLQGIKVTVKAKQSDSNPIIYEGISIERYVEIQPKEQK